MPFYKEILLALVMLIYAKDGLSAQTGSPVAGIPEICVTRNNELQGNWYESNGTDSFLFPSHLKFIKTGPAYGKLEGFGEAHFYSLTEECDGVLITDASGVLIVAYSFDLSPCGLRLENSSRERLYCRNGPGQCPRDCGFLRIVEVRFEHPRFPEGEWISAELQGKDVAQTTQGNRVKIVARIENLEGKARIAEVRFLDAVTEHLLPKGSVMEHFAAGEQKDIEYVWTEGGSAWTTAGAPRSPYDIKVAVSADGQVFDNKTRKVDFLPRPVVLVHGLWSNAGAWSRYPEYLAAAHPGWKGRAFAVGDGRVAGSMDTGVAPDPEFPDIETNALELARYIYNVQRKTNAWNIDLVAHSLGGLISRYYIQNLMPSPVVAHLVMLGTPNQGTPCADQWLGLRQLETRYVLETFNSSVIFRRGVLFSALAGNPSPVTCLAVARGDLFVDVESVHWSLENVGLTGSYHTELNSSLSDFSSFIKRRLDGTGDGLKDTVLFPEGTATTDLEDPPQLIALEEIRLEGQTREIPLEVSEASALSISLALSSTTRATLRNPAGKLVEPLGNLTGALSTFRVANPSPGTWHLYLEATQRSTAEADVLLSAAIEGNPVHLSVAVSPADGKGRVALRATLTRAGKPLLGASVTAKLQSGRDSGSTVGLVDDGLHDDGVVADGVYGGVAESLAPGSYEIVVRSQGPGVSRTITAHAEVPDRRACAPGPETLCLLGGRFRVEAAWRSFQGSSGRGQSVLLTSDTGYFWFFDPSNVELVIKVLDGRAVNSSFWIFYGALSNVEYSLTITDTETGATRTYWNPPGQFASRGDTTAFPDVAAFQSPVVSSSETLGARSAVTSECAAGPSRLCLGGRFSVSVHWRDFQGGSGEGKAVKLTEDTGYFWFFNDSNVELIMKALDGRAVNGHFWFFYGALSSVEYEITVTDTQSGNIVTYRNPAGNFASVGDTSAFPP